jgi:transposase
MEQWLDARHKVLVEGVSKREVPLQTGLHWKTIEKILAHPQPPGWRRTKPAPPRQIDPYLDHAKAILQADKKMPRKQRHTAMRLAEHRLARATSDSTAPPRASS